MALNTPVASREKLADELTAFERLRPELLDNHRGQYVAIHGGRVIDSDPDEFALAARTEPIATREGPVAVCHVSEAQAAPTDYPCAHFESPAVAEPDA